MSIRWKPSGEDGSAERRQSDLAGLGEEHIEMHNLLVEGSLTGVGTPVNVEGPSRERVSTPHYRKWGLALIGASLLLSLVVVVVVVALSASSGSSTSSDTTPPSYSSFRLAPSVVPHRYNLTLTPRLEPHFDFQGYVEITLKISEPTTMIVLHAVDLTIASAYFVDQTSVPLDVSFNETTGMALLVPRDKRTFQPHDEEAKLLISFHGLLRDDMRGFYRSNYTINGQTFWMAATQFESTSARRAFPCFDEPAMKAEFTVTVNVPAHTGTTVLANMPPASIQTSAEQDITTFHFQETVKMSSYLVALVIGNLEYVEDFTHRGMPVRVYSTIPGGAEKGRFAVATAVKVINFLEIFLEDLTPIPKMDLVTVPDFAPGAMENWGLVTFRETALFIDDADASGLTRQNIASVIAHELAHQWFGNLVTASWWSDLWLNEGFATYFEYFVVDMIYPEFKYMSQFIPGELQRALARDALVSHPMQNTGVTTPDEIGAMFDTITYSKGASVLRMIANFLGTSHPFTGTSLFREGLHDYLHTFAFKTAETEDLWRILSHQKVENDAYIPLFDTWTRYEGYPLIEVSATDTSIHLRQVPFRLDSSPQTRDDTQWWIPVSLLYPDGQIHMVELQAQTESVDILPCDTCSPFFISANAGQTGVYRVEYSLPLFRSLIEAWKDNQLSEEDRTGLLADHLSFTHLPRGEKSQQRVENAFQVLELLRFEAQSYIIWKSSLEELRWLHEVLYCTRDFSSFMRSILKQAVTQLGWKPHPNEPHTTSLLRSLLLSHAMDFNLREISSEGAGLFELFLKNESAHPIPSDIRPAVYHAFIINGGEEAFGEILARYRRETDPVEKRWLLTALGSSRNPYLLRETLGLLLTGDVRRQDAYYVVATVAANPVGLDLAWDFLKEHFSVLNTSHWPVDYFITSVARHFTTPFHMEEIQEFFLHNPPHTGTRIVEEALKLMRHNIDWIEVNEGNACTFLSRRVCSMDATNCTEPHYFDEDFCGCLCGLTLEDCPNEGVDFAACKCFHVWDDWRLPDWVVPLSYDLLLNPDLDTKTYQGVVGITVRVQEPTSILIFHAADLVITDLGIFEGDEGLVPTSMELDSTYDYLIVTFDEVFLSQTTLNLDIHFSGTLRDDHRGIFLASVDGQDQHIVATHFKPGDARRAFPCFDEPQFKASFTLRIATISPMVVLANMPQDGDPVAMTLGGVSKVVYNFQPSVPMSSYLVAFVMGQLNSIGGWTSDQVPIHLYTPPSREEEGYYALGISEGIMDILASYLDVPYPLPKLDLIALPDLGFTAVENWGLVLFQQTSLLVNGNTTRSEHALRHIALPVIHELAHQWFGNLVTMDFWGNVWLSEGFASYFEFLGASILQPWSSAWETFLVMHQQRAFAYDALSSIHPLDAKDVASPDECRALFDAISYSKGASILYMVHSLLGDDVFRSGLNTYLSAHQLHNADSHDLWQAMALSAGDVVLAPKLSTWSQNSGFPIVSIELAEGDTTHLQLSQRRFMLNSESIATNESLWWVPVWMELVSVEENTTTSLLVELQTTSTIYPLPWSLDSSAETSVFLKANVARSGFYRVHYDDTLLNLLEHARSQGHLDDVSWAGLLNDYLGFATAGQDLVRTFSLIEQLAEERSLVVWESVVSETNWLTSLFWEEDCYLHFQRYMRNIVHPAAVAAGYDAGQANKSSHLYHLLLSQALRYEDEEVGEEALQQFRLFLEDEVAHPLPHEISGAVYAAAVAFGDISDYEAVHARYLVTTDPKERHHLLLAMGAARQPSLIHRTLRFALSSAVRVQDRWPLVSAIAEQQYGRNFAWDFFKVNFASFNVMGSGLHSLLSALTRHFATSQQLEDMETFFAAHPPAVGARVIAEVKEVVKHNVHWLHHHAADVCALVSSAVDD